MTILILAILAGIGFAVAYFVPDSKPRPADIMVEGDPTPTPSILEEDEVERMREELANPPVKEIDKEEVREELLRSSESGGVTEAEKERMRAELRK